MSSLPAVVPIGICLACAAVLVWAARELGFMPWFRGVITRKEDRRETLNQLSEQVSALDDLAVLGSAVELEHYSDLVNEAWWELEAARDSINWDRVRNIITNVESYASTRLSTSEDELSQLAFSHLLQRCDILREKWNKLVS